MKKDSLDDHLIECPIELTLSVIGDKWKVLILRELMFREYRFNALLRQLKPISQTMLARQLQALEKDGVVLRSVYPQSPPKVVYSITELGQGLAPVLDAMGRWGMASRKHFAKIHPQNIDTKRAERLLDHLAQM